jgi:hypothetical protein
MRGRGIVSERGRVESVLHREGKRYSKRGEEGGVEGCEERERGGMKVGKRKGKIW